MKGPRALVEWENNWRTAMGLSFGGERVVYRGKDLFHELQDLRWMELFLLGITGRRFDDNQIRIFEGLWTLGNSYPDPRIWNNRIASIAGTARSTATLALSASIAVSEATIYGRRPDIRAIEFLTNTRSRMNNGEKLADIIREEIRRFRVIPGFGRPIVNGDERIRPGRELARKYNCDKAPHFLLVFEVENTLQDMRYRMKMNAAALGAAMAADQGLTPREYYLFLTPSFTAGILPCYIDAVERGEGLFLPLRCDAIDYDGASPRTWD